MRLIDADNLKEHSFALDDDIHFSCEAVDTDDIDNAPTIDAKPVVHAHWTIIKDNWDDDATQCSRCGEQVVLMNNFEEFDVECMKYCPNCGAKMDEVTEDD